MLWVYSFKKECLIYYVESKIVICDKKSNYYLLVLLLLLINKSKTKVDNIFYFSCNCAKVISLTTTLQFVKEKIREDSRHKFHMVDPSSLHFGDPTTIYHSLIPLYYNTFALFIYLSLIKFYYKYIKIKYYRVNLLFNSSVKFFKYHFFWFLLIYFCI